MDAWAVVWIYVTFKELPSSTCCVICKFHPAILCSLHWLHVLGMRCISSVWTFKTTTWLCMFHFWVSSLWYLQRFSRRNPSVYLIYQCYFFFKKKTSLLIEYAAILLTLSIQRGWWTYKPLSLFTKNYFSTGVCRVWHVEVRELCECVLSF